MSDMKADMKAWHDQVNEAIVDEPRAIIDPHHHLWERGDGNDYMLDDLWEDTGSGHNIIGTVYMECGSFYYEDGPDHLKPVGETERVTAVAEESKAGAGKGRPEILGIVAKADLALGDKLDEVLDGHVEKGKGRFRGIRHALSSAPDGVTLFIPGGAPKGLAADEAFRAGVKRLGARGFTYDSWHYHFQCDDFLGLAEACPDTQMVLDHFATPLGVGPYADKRDEIFAAWKADMTKIAACDNVVAKIGGLAMPDNGFGWMGRETPATSDELVEAQKRYYDVMIDCFGPSRCMFESNFPVDKTALSYQVYWNGMKKIAADYTEDEQDAMFRGVAARVYGL